MTTAEAAQFLRLKVRTLENWRWRGAGPDYRTHGRRVVYTKADLIAYSNKKNDGNTYE